MTPEGRIQKAIMLALSEHCGHLCTVWRQNTGMAYLKGEGGRLRPVRFGVPGQADLSGLIHGTGQRLEIEIKTPTGRQGVHQRRFQTIITNAGGIYLLARSAEEAVALVRAAAKE